MTSRRGPNFLIFITDQQRWDHVGCYGNDLLRTPNIDALARHGVRFEKFFVSSPLCQPNRATLMTGRTPMVHGVRSNGIPLDRRAVTFVDLLRAAGWRTAFVGKSHLQNITGWPPGKRVPRHPERKAPPAALQEAMRGDRTGAMYEAEVNPTWRDAPMCTLAQPYYGYETVGLVSSYLERSKDKENAIPDPRYTVPQGWRTRIPEHLYHTSHVARQAVHYLENHKLTADGQPFCLTCSFPDPHHPFTPPGKYWDMYDPDTIPVPQSHHAPLTSRNMPPELWFAYARGSEEPDAQWPVPVTERQAREAIALTYGMITMVDDAIGRVVGALSPETAANTVIVFTSDHGDYMGDHGVILKLGLHFQGVIRVPFIWTDPQGTAGTTRRDLGATIDIASTILARAGLQSYYGNQGNDLFDNATKRDGVVIDDYGMAVFRDPDAAAGLMSYVTDRWRLSICESSDWGELYDYENDPHELHNLWENPEHRESRSMLTHRLLREVIALRDRALTPTAVA